MRVLPLCAWCLAFVTSCSDAPTGVPTGFGVSISFTGTSRPDTVHSTITAAGDSVFTSQLLSVSPCFAIVPEAGLDGNADLVITITAQERDLVCPAVVPTASVARVVVHGVPAGQRTAILMLRYVRLNGPPSSTELMRTAIMLP